VSVVDATEPGVCNFKTIWSYNKSPGRPNFSDEAVLRAREALKCNP